MHTYPVLTLITLRKPPAVYPSYLYCLVIYVIIWWPDYRKPELSTGALFEKGLELRVFL